MNSTAITSVIVLSKSIQHVDARPGRVLERIADRVPDHGRRVLLAPIVEEERRRPGWPTSSRP